MQNLPKAKNYCVTLKIRKGVLFLQIIEGGIDKSYGIEVAKLAGVPTAVIDRSAQILIDLESEKIESQPTKIPEIKWDFSQENILPTDILSWKD